MAKQKSYQILIIVFLIGFLSCRKRYSEELTTVDIYLVNPLTGQGYSGLGVTLEGLEYKGGGFDANAEREILCQTETDENGKAQLSFNRITYHDLSQKDYDYQITFDKSTIDAPGGDYYSTIPQFLKPTFNEHNTFTLKFMPYGGHVRHFKNVNCFDANDKIQWKRIEYYTSSDANDEFLEIDWIGGQLSYTGCVDWIQPVANVRCDMYLYEFKVTRNGIDSIYYDTFVNHAYITDTFKIFY